MPRKSLVRLTDRPDMTLDVYRGRKTTMQQQQQLPAQLEQLKTVQGGKRLLRILLWCPEDLPRLWDRLE